MTGLMLLGPTASGKTAAALALAARLAADGTGCEIISVDSALVYRGMDVGTAKPAASERAAVPHHLIDVIEPHESYSAARFADDARRLIGEIGARGRVPLLVGGTMLYARALLAPLDELPPADPAVRAAIDTEAARVGWPALHGRLMQIDPLAAARFSPNDAQRIQRALEVHATTGRPLSAHWGRAGDAAGTDAAASPLLVASLEPGDRAVLHARIAARFDAMLADGLLDEVRRLRGDARLNPQLPSMRCVGYRQAWQWLDAQPQPPWRVLVDTGVAATRQLAKRQLTWLRSLPVHVRLDPLRGDPVPALHAAWRAAQTPDSHGSSPRWTARTSAAWSDST